MIESFWGRVQTELLNRRRWKTRIELANALFEYFEIFHNRRRRHSALGMLTPIEYEKLHRHRHRHRVNPATRLHQTRGTSGITRLTNLRSVQIGRAFASSPLPFGLLS